jgi:hypothetical protein
MKTITRDLNCKRHTADVTKTAVKLVNMKTITGDLNCKRHTTDVTKTAVK